MATEVKKKQRETQMRNCCFTLNNYTKEQITSLEKLDANFIAFGEEVAETGTKHLQGYVEFRTPKAFSTVHRMLFNAHIEKRRGKAIDAFNYCIKGKQSHEEWETLGTKGPNFGKDAITHVIGKISRQGTSGEEIRDELKEGAKIIDIIESHPDDYMRYSNGIEKMAKIIDREKKKEKDDKKVVLSDWQKTALQLLADQDERQLVWVVDTVGGHGKSFLRDFIEDHYDSVFGCENNKSADITHAYNGEKIVIFDIPKSTEERINYDIIERIKNGRAFSPKYESCSKHFAKPKVIVFSNQYPNFSAMSPDRWIIVDISNEPLPIKSNGKQIEPKATFVSIKHDWPTGYIPFIDRTNTGTTMTVKLPTDSIGLSGATDTTATPTSSIGIVAAQESSTSTGLGNTGTRPFDSTQTIFIKLADYETRQ